jgi:hypothetical protein
MEAVREESGGDDSKRLQKRMVETSPRCPKSSRSCFAGSASANAGKFSTLVERTRMVERRQKQLTEFHRAGQARNVSAREH